MNNVVLYRKYRPKKFGEVVGQIHIVRTLTNALKEGKVGHGYLFFGPRGSGKTSIARLLAKSLNCLNPDAYEPCTVCESCLETQENRAIDLVEIDAASNRGIDEIRQLKEDIKFSPLKSKYKVFVIDEVHQLTKEAFNALLKTLEEPPSHAIFILATTDIEKVPETILSRVQRFDFKKFTIPELFGSLKMISEKEGLTAEDEALKLIAINATGSLRDAQSMLNQIISFTGGKITQKSVEEILGLVSNVLIAKFADLIVKSDLSGAITFVRRLENSGHNLAKFLESLVEYLRKIMILKVDSQLINLFGDELSPQETEMILNQAKEIELPKIQKLLSSLLSAQSKMKYSDFPHIPIELALVENML